MTKSLLIVAHGSRRETSNNEIRDLAKRIHCLEHPFREVKPAFLELAEPSIPNAIREAISGGATEVVVLPYFLSAGRHVVKDIPAEVEIVRAEHPGITITIAPYFGEAEEIPYILLAQVQ